MIHSCQTCYLLLRVILIFMILNQFVSDFDLKLHTDDFDFKSFLYKVILI